VKDLSGVALEPFASWSIGNQWKPVTTSEDCNTSDLKHINPNPKKQPPLTCHPGGDDEAAGELTGDDG
jgi:hypothetical protein